MPMANLSDKVDAFFRISERGSTIANEVKGGLITFLAMSYILVVNPDILYDIPSAAEYGFNALFTATALAAIASCLLMGLYSRFPVALAPGMGVNAFLSYTICLEMGFDYPQALLTVFLSGIMFFIMSISGWRTKIIDSIPASMKMSITAGIGFFIAMIGLYNSGIIVHGSGSALTLGDMTDAGVLLGVFCIVATLALWSRGWWGAVIGGLVLTWVVGLAVGHVGIESAVGTIPHVEADGLLSSPDLSLLGAMFTDFDMFGSDMIISFIAATVSLFVVDVFDTTGTVIGVSNEAGMTRPDGSIPDIDKVFNADSGASLIGAVFGTSTTTSYVESTTGIAAGARTGLMPVVVSIMFILALGFSGVFATFTSACTVGALVLVGILMIKNVRGIDWGDPVNCAMGFLTIFMMALTNSITNGIAFGVFAYIVGMVFSGRRENITPTLWILGLVFFVYLALDFFIIPNM